MNNWLLLKRIFGSAVKLWISSGDCSKTANVCHHVTMLVVSNKILLIKNIGQLFPFHPKQLDFLHRKKDWMVQVFPSEWLHTTNANEEVVWHDNRGLPRSRADSSRTYDEGLMFSVKQLDEWTWGQCALSMLGTHRKCDGWRQLRRSRCWAVCE